MPRGVAEFEAIGCKVTPYPVDFRTGDSTALTEYSLANTLLRWQTALHEWLGLWVYGVNPIIRSPQQLSRSDGRQSISRTVFAVNASAPRWLR